MSSTIATAILADPNLAYWGQSSDQHFHIRPPTHKLITLTRFQSLSTSNYGIQRENRSVVMRNICSNYFTLFKPNICSPD